MDTSPPAAGRSTLSFAILIFIAHNLANSLLLSAWNPLRCAYWNQLECTHDEGWMANWFSFAHLHVTTVLGCMLAKSTPSQQEKLAYLICAIITTYLAEGVFTLDRLDWLMAALQTMFYLGIMSWIFYDTYDDPNKTIHPQPYFPKLVGSRTNMSLSISFDARSKFPMATIALGMHLLSSLMRVVDMTFGSGRSGYRGDISSAIYQSISSFAVCDMMLVAFLLVFCLKFYTSDQHKLVLWGQAGVLFLSQVMLAGNQGAMLDPEMAMAGSIGTFVFIVIAIVGAL